MLSAALDYVIVDRGDMEVLQILLAHGTDVFWKTRLYVAVRHFKNIIFHPSTLHPQPFSGTQ